MSRRVFGVPASRITRRVVLVAATAAAVVLVYVVGNPVGLINIAGAVVGGYGHGCDRRDSRAYDDAHTLKQAHPTITERRNDLH